RQTKQLPAPTTTYAANGLCPHPHRCTRRARTASVARNEQSNTVPRSVEQRAGTHGRKDPLKHEGRRVEKKEQKKSPRRAADTEPAARPRPDAATNYRHRLETAILSRGTPFSARLRV
uniref:Uncharacterized protein n=2 Tax=Ixodes scapularis TaxID=6945 RepID=A0A1S4LA87_IXOSC